MAFEVVFHEVVGDFLGVDKTLQAAVHVAGVP